MRRFIIVFLLLCLEFCVVKSKSHSDFWKQIFDVEKLLSKSGKYEEKFEALYGKMEPKKESILQKDGNHLFLSASINNHNVGSFSYKKKPSQNDKYFKKIEYRKSKLNEKPTYEILAYSYIHYPSYTLTDFLNWADKLTQIMTHEKEPEKSLKKSLLYNFLCSKLNCFVYKNNSYINLTFRIEKQNFSKYPSDYKNINKLLKKMRANIKVFSGRTKLYQLKNTKKSISLLFFPSKVSIPNLKQLSILINLELDYHGLKININQLGYQLKRTKSSKKEVIKGFYYRYPRCSTSGNLFYIFSPKFVNFFLPKDIDAYLKDYFDLVVSSSKHKGRVFESTFRAKGNKVVIETLSYKEVFQNKHKPFFESSERKKGERSFFKDIRKVIVKDLR